MHGVSVDCWSWFTVFVKKVSVKNKGADWSGKERLKNCFLHAKRSCTMLESVELKERLNFHFRCSSWLEVEVVLTGRSLAGRGAGIDR